MLTVQGSLNHGNLAQDLADPREGIVLTDRDLAGAILPIGEPVVLTVHQSQGLPGPLHPDLLPSFQPGRSHLEAITGQGGFHLARFVGLLQGVSAGAVRQPPPPAYTVKSLEEEVELPREGPTASPARTGAALTWWDSYQTRPRNPNEIPFLNEEPRTSRWVKNSDHREPFADGQAQGFQEDTLRENSFY